MNLKTKIVRTLGVIIFSVGALFGIALFGGAVWGDLEAVLFNTSMSGEATLKTLRCPVMITPKEPGTVSAAVKNSLDRSTEFMIRTHISHGYVTLMREMTAKLPLDPGESERLEWTVTPEDAAYGNTLILVRVYLFGRYPLPSRRGSCGILVINTPHFTGSQVFAFILVASLLGMAIGMGLWVVGNRPLSGLGLNVAHAMIGLAGTVLVGMIVGFIGWWIIGVIIFVITVILIGAIFGYFVKGT